MKAKQCFLTGAVILGLLVGVLVSPSSAMVEEWFDDTEVSISKEIHNGDDQQRTATDLSFTVGVPDFDMDDYYIVSYTITTNPDLGVSPTIVEATYGANPGPWSLDVRYDDINVPYCTNVRIAVDLTLNDGGNWIRIEDVKWSYNNDPYDVMIAEPDQGFEYPDPCDYDWDEETYDTEYTYVNSDPCVPIQVNYLRFYLGTEWCDPSNWSCPMSGMLFEEVTGPIEVGPGSTYHVNLEGIPTEYRFIYVVGNEEYQMPGFDYETHPFRHGHEVAMLECGAWGYHRADLNQDCYVNLIDFSLFASDWLECSVPFETNCTQGPETTIIGVGFAFDPYDTEGPARILFLYDDRNEGILEPNDIINEYRGEEVNNGAELFELIKTMPDVDPGEPVEVQLTRGGFGDPIHAEPIAGPINVSITAPGVWVKCSFTECQKIELTPVPGRLGGTSHTCACEDIYPWDCYHRWYFDPGPHPCQGDPGSSSCRFVWIYYECYNKRSNGTTFNDCLTGGSPVGK